LIGSVSWSLILELRKPPRVYERMSLIARAIEEIPVGTRIAAAFVQSAAVRAAGFAIVPLASLAPAVKILYVIMMVRLTSRMVTDK
jgi:Trk-type K+ transport system membrane component